MRLIADCHCDTLSKSLDENKSLWDTKYSFNLKYANFKMLQCMAAFIAPEYVDNGFDRAINIINKFYDECNDMVLINSLETLEDFYKSDKVGVILTIENGSAIDGDLENVDRLYDKGIRIMGITWNDNNDLAYANGAINDNGLTLLGKEYIRKLNERNIVPDVSHCSDKSFFDVIDITEKPIIATHSNARSVCNNQRNLTDEQIKEIVKVDGLIGICFYSRFLREKGRANIDDIVKQVAYIADLVGVKYISFGSDFDGMDKNEQPRGIRSIKDYIKIINKLKKYGFSECEIDMIAGQNFLNFMKRYLV